MIGAREDTRQTGPVKPSKGECDAGGPLDTSAIAGRSNGRVLAPARCCRAGGRSHSGDSVEPHLSHRPSQCRSCFSLVLSPVGLCVAKVAVVGVADAMPLRVTLWLRHPKCAPGYGGSPVGTRCVSHVDRSTWDTHRLCTVVRPRLRTGMGVASQSTDAGEGCIRGFALSQKWTRRYFALNFGSAPAAKSTVGRKLLMLPISHRNPSVDPSSHHAATTGQPHGGAWVRLVAQSSQAATPK
jgi:hypothetical protein